MACGTKNAKEQLQEVQEVMVTAMLASASTTSLLSIEKQISVFFVGVA